MRPGIGEDGPGVGFVFGAYLELQRAKAGFEDAGVFAGEKCLDASGLQAKAGHIGLKWFSKVCDGDDV